MQTKMQTPNFESNTEQNHPATYGLGVKVVYASKQQANISTTPASRVACALVRNKVYKSFENIDPDAPFQLSSLPILPFWVALRFVSSLIDN